MLLLGLGLLFFGGEALIRGAVSVGLKFGLTPLLVGVTIVAFGTSSPELIVSIEAARRGFGGLAIGNVVGSNICNIALVLGVAALIRPIEVHLKLVRFDVPIVITGSILMILMLHDGRMSRLDGALLFIGAIVYTLFAIWDTRHEGSDVQHEFADGIGDSGMSLRMAVTFVITGIVLLAAGGRMFVVGAAEIALLMGVSKAVIALSIVAFGTSLPELATAIVASIKNQGDIAVGNAIGSNIFNIFAILGLTGLLLPLGQGAVDWVDYSLMLGTSILLLPLMFTRMKLERWEGALLLGIYFLYTTWLITAHQ